MFLILLFSFTVLLYPAKGTIQWVGSPADVYVQVGETATFPCNFTGSDAVPLWIINNGIYHHSQLPSRHTYSNGILYVDNVEVTDNMTQYQCEIYDPEIFTSTIGVLYISEQDHALSTTTSAVTTTTWTQKSSEVLWTENVTEASSFTKEDKKATNDTIDEIHTSGVSYGHIQPNTNNNILGYGIIVGAICFCVTILCTVTIITLAILLYKYSTYRYRYRYRYNSKYHCSSGCHNPISVPDVRYDATLVRTNEAYDITTAQRKDPTYDELKI